jgi:hypothetical protein
MPDIIVKYLDEMERYTGSFEHGQQFFFAGKSLGLSKIGMNAIDDRDRESLFLRAV